MVKPRFSNIELVQPTSSPFSRYMPSFGGRTLLTSQDRILVNNGGSGAKALDIYLSLFVNPVVFQGWDKVMTDITSKELIVEPGADSDEARKIADFVTAQLKAIGTSSDSPNPLLPAQGGIDGLTRALGTAYITGFSPVELVWGRDASGDRVVKYYKARDARLFRMEYDPEVNITRPRLLSKADPLRGSAIPAHKFIFHRYYAVPNDDDYGCGLGRNLYYPVEWQKQLMSYWLMLIDKTVMPSTVGSYDAEARATEEDIATFEEAVRNFGQDSAITLPPGFKIDTLDFKTSSADVLEKLLDKIDGYIESIVVGESGTGKSGSGSQAKDAVSRGIGLASSKALSDSICETLNQTIVKWLVWANFGKLAPLPRVWRSFEAEINNPPANIEEVNDIAVFIDLLTKLDQVGLSLDRNYIQSRLGAPLKKAASKPGAAGAGTSDAPGNTGGSGGTALFENVPSPADLLGGG